MVAPSCPTVSRRLMTDNRSPEDRSHNMSRVKGRNTKPELLVRSLLHQMGYRFRLHRADLPGRPDIVLPKHRKVIFTHGCFWHGHNGCRKSNRPSTNREFWDKKIDGNISRDARNIAALEEAGWQVLIIWECKTRDHTILRQVLSAFMTSSPLSP